MNVNDAKALVIKAGIELVKNGLIARTWGNVSCRIDTEAFAVTPSGRDYLSLTSDDIVVVKISDLSYSGQIKPSSEKGLHAAVYRRFPEMNFVIHTHQENASAISATGLASFPISISNDRFEKEILCAEYALPGTKALRKNVAEALKKTESNAVILKNHGALCFGVDCESTLQTAHDLEKACVEFLSGKRRIAHEDKPDDVEFNKSLLNARKQSLLDRKGGFVLLNTDPEVIQYSKCSEPLKPYLDDYAQIVGLNVSVADNRKSLIFKGLSRSSAVFVKNTGALCWGKDETDAEAVSMILRKNCKAYFAASLFGRPKPINAFESALMRLVFLKKYSKLSRK